MKEKEEIEEWRPVRGYEDRYEISNFGNVKTLERKTPNKVGMMLRKERLLKSERNLKEHVKIHIVVRPFPCDQCDKRFLRPYSLELHKRRHTGIRSHTCDKCEKGFFSHGDLNKHIKVVHIGLRTYFCKECEKGFFTKTSLTIHERLHTGEKPFHCNLCDRRFTQKANLYKHVKAHDGTKYHHHCHCGLRYMRKNNLLKHIQNKHVDEEMVTVKNTLLEEKGEYCIDLPELTPCDSTDLSEWGMISFGERDINSLEWDTPMFSSYTVFDFNVAFNKDSVKY